MEFRTRVSLPEYPYCGKVSKIKRDRRQKAQIINRNAGKRKKSQQRERTQIQEPEVQRRNTTSISRKDNSKKKEFLKISFKNKRIYIKTRNIL